MVSGGGGSVNWSGGTIAGTGTLVTNPDSAPDISGLVVLQRAWNPTNGISISGTTGALNIDGATVTVGAGQSVSISSTASQQIFGTGNLINNGQININAASVKIDSAVFSNGSGAIVDFPLNRTLTITGSGTDVANYNFGTGGGTLDFAGGTRTFTGGAINGSAATIRVSGGSVTTSATTGFTAQQLQVTGGALVDNATTRTFSNATFSGGSATFNGASVIFDGSLNVSGGTLTGTSNFDTVTSSSSFAWSGGTIAGSGTLTTVAGMNPVTITGPVVLGRNWVNNIGVTLSGTGSMTINSPATFTNNSTFSITSTASAPILGTGTFLNSASGTLSEAVANNLNIQSVFNNQGTFSIGGGGVTALGASTINDNATYTVLTGNTLAFNGNRSFTGGGVNASSTGGIQFQTGTVTFSGTSAFSPSGNTTFAGGSATFNIGTATFSGGLDLNSGTLGGTANLLVPNTGAFNWTGGTLGAGGTLTTNGASSVSGLAALTRNWTAANPINITSSGTLNLSGGAVTTPTLNVAGLLKGAGTITGNVVNTGTVAPGASPGVINIVGDYTQSASGVLQLELGGLSPGAGHDQLVVSNNVFLNGTLLVTQFGSFIPGFIDTFQAITAGGSITGAFSTVTVPLLFAGLSPSYGSQVVQLGGAVGFGATFLDPLIVREDKDVFALVGEDVDIFKKLQEYLTCN